MNQSDHCKGFDISKETSPFDTYNIQRRPLFKKVIASTILSTLGMSVAADTVKGKAKEHKGAHHHHHGPHVILTDISGAALACVQQGELCQQHCFELLKSGDSSIADCAARVHETLAVCSALSSLAISNSPHLNAFSKVCVSICEDCESECLKHADKHRECKSCAQACNDCIKACQKLT